MDQNEAVQQIYRPPRKQMNRDETVRGLQESEMRIARQIDAPKHFPTNNETKFSRTRTNRVNLSYIRSSSRADRENNHRSVKNNSPIFLITKIRNSPQSLTSRQLNRHRSPHPPRLLSSHEREIKNRSLQIRAPKISPRPPPPDPPASGITNRGSAERSRARDETPKDPQILEEASTRI